MPEDKVQRGVLNNSTGSNSLHLLEVPALKHQALLFCWHSLLHGQLQLDVSNDLVGTSPDGK
ncbi:MAG: hypothetical protein MPL62_16575 [Alphaproteobacteria bacterium]|nr:hypothetical protein [Alphaproteobacteria bacterium]